MENQKVGCAQETATARRAFTIAAALNSLSFMESCNNELLSQKLKLEGITVLPDYNSGGNGFCYFCQLQIQHFFPKFEVGYGSF